MLSGSVVKTEVKISPITGLSLLLPKASMFGAKKE